MNMTARTHALTLQSFQLLGSYGRKPTPANAAKPLATSLRHVEGLKSAPRRARASEIIEIVPEWLSSHASTVKRSAHAHIDFVFHLGARNSSTRARRIFRIGFSVTSTAIFSFKKSQRRGGAALSNSSLEKNVGFSAPTIAKS